MEMQTVHCLSFHNNISEPVNVNDDDDDVNDDKTDGSNNDDGE